ncbi:MAG TPA: hypothetical protein VHF58_03480 [Solirubrobacterales bacterium]|nr:hypothetical protein [Solirubrobacterales bacterium]
MANKRSSGNSGTEVQTEDFRAALESALERAAQDDRIGPLLRAAGLRMRFEFTDVGLILNVAAAGEDSERLAWSFGDDPDFRPKLELTMDAETANRYLQGRESLAVALARGRAHCRGESRTALLYLPATRLLCEPYRKVVQAGYPALAA